MGCKDHTCGREKFQTVLKLITTQKEKLIPLGLKSPGMVFLSLSLARARPSVMKLPGKPGCFLTQLKATEDHLSSASPVPRSPFVGTGVTVLAKALLPSS